MLRNIIKRKDERREEKGDDRYMIDVGKQEVTLPSHYTFYFIQLC